MSGPANPFDQQGPIEGVKKIWAVASGKGGVGKSTVTSNLAVSLQMLGLKVGVLDADIYGPSQPRMFGALSQKPEVDAHKKLIPIERMGVKLMSLGFLVDEDLAVVWRGPMLFKAMNQLIREVDWGSLDVLLVDLPPGTGDVQLSLVQKVPVDAAIIVTTPQNVALADVKKSIDMFERTGVRIAGIIENMSYYENPSTGEKIQIFPQGDLMAFVDAKKLNHFGQIPLSPSIAQGSEMGIPQVKTHADSASTRVFESIARKVADQLKPN